MEIAVTGLLHRTFNPFLVLTKLEGYQDGMSGFFGRVGRLLGSGKVRELLGGWRELIEQRLVGRDLEGEVFASRLKGGADETGNKYFELPPANG
jgi:ribosome modulation factor